ncbi:hypothetical protein [Devosia sp. DBB001]|nr:hypothetical protein [Devosia sp. DBB001]
MPRHAWAREGEAEVGIIAPTASNPAINVKRNLFMRVP